MISSVLATFDARETVACVTWSIKFFPQKLKNLTRRARATKHQVGLALPWAVKPLSS